jgi:hypothetical protein
MSREAAFYIESMLSRRDPLIIKRTLQDLCKLMREKNHPSIMQRVSLTQKIIGMLTLHENDQKIRRWSINSLALLDQKEYCIKIMPPILEKYNDDPETVSAIIAALFKVLKKKEEVIGYLKNIDPLIVYVSALQHADFSQIDSKFFPIKIDNVSVDILKSALIVIGLNKVPEFMFQKKYKLGDIVKELSRHDDAVVSQYSVWSVTENRNLNINDIAINYADIQSKKDNVRAWMLQLLGRDAEHAREYSDLIDESSSDSNSEIRLGLAVGLSDCYFSGLSDIVIKWLSNEENFSVKMKLIEHVIKFSYICDAYHPISLDLYKSYGEDSVERQMMEAASSGTCLYPDFKRIKFGNDNSLLGAVVMNNNTFNVNGNLTAGAISASGSASNFGDTQSKSNSIDGSISLIERFIELNADALGDTSEIRHYVSEFKKEPTKEKALSILGVLKSIPSTVEGVSKIVEVGKSLIGFF